MLKKWLFGFWLIASAALLILAVPRLYPQEEAPKVLHILRVWNAEKEPALSHWLRKRAAVFEKETGVRVYLRSVAEADWAALENTGDALPPDLLFSARGSVPAALVGYALAVREEGAEQITPEPTGSLFFRPSPSPGPTPVPPPWPDAETLSAVLSPASLMDAMPGTVLSADPAGDFQKGTARAALVTPGQASSLTVGFRAFALPDGKGFAPLKAEAFSDDGASFLTALLSDESQHALSGVGLFSPRLRLYAADDPLRAMIDASRPAADMNP